MTRVCETCGGDGTFRCIHQRFWPKVDQRGPDDCWEWTRVLQALYEARLQLVYLDERHPTGSTPAVIAHIERALEKAVPWETIASAIEARSDATVKQGAAEDESASDAQRHD